MVLTIYLSMWKISHFEIAYGLKHLVFGKNSSHMYRVIAEEIDIVEKA